jgi:hypothetical protein
VTINSDVSICCSFIGCNSLETELCLQEDQVLKWLTRLISGDALELLLDHVLERDLSGGSSLRGLHLLLRNPSLAVESLGGESVSGGDDVVIVDILNEWLHSLSLESLLLRHSLGDVQRSLLDSHNKGVTVRSGLCSLIEHLNDDGLLTGLTSLSENADSSCLNAKNRVDSHKSDNIRTIYPLSC